MEIKTTFRFYNDNDGPYFGAYKTGSMTDGNPTIMFNMDAALQILKDEEDLTTELQDHAMQTITHEFIHSLQEWLGKEMDEYEVEKILGSYNEKWNAFNVEQENPDDSPANDVFKIGDFINWMNASKATTATELKEEIRELFKPVILWIEAEQKAKTSNP